MKKNNNKSNSLLMWKEFFQLILYTKPPKLMIALAIILELLSSIGMLYIPITAKNLINSFQDGSIYYGLIAVIVLLFMISSLASGISIFLLNRIGQSIVLNIRKKIFSKILKLPIAKYDNSKVGDLSSRVINDSQILRNVLSDHLISLFSGLFKIIGSIIGLIVIDSKLTFVLVGSSILIVLSTIPFSKKIYRLSRESQRNLGEMNSIINNALSEVKLVKSSHAEIIEEEKGNENFQRMYNIGIQEGNLQAIMSPILSFISLFIAIGVLGYGAVRVVLGDLSMGNMTGFALYMFQLFPPLSQLMYVYNQLQRSKGASERTIEILKAPIENFDGEKRIQWNNDIVISDITFSYDTNKEILKNVSLVIPENTITAIVGPSGSGKTTLFSLIERFYSPTKGSISMGRTNIESFSLGKWREGIGYVSQEISIIDGTVLDNICYGLKRDVTMSEIDLAIQISNLDEFISQLRFGLHTNLGERGVRLSGGQKQRIGIARAILKLPQILLLDEATSNLDSVSEVKITEKLRQFIKNRTTLIIAHRLSTVVDANQIIFLDKGEITGIGTHQDLLTSHQKYAEFVSKQLVD